MAILLLKGAFIASKQGKTGLTVTVDLYRIALADGSSSKVVTDGACSEVGGGVYVYRYANADCTSYEYVSVFKTADATVDQQHVHGVHFVMPDELVSSRATQTSVDLRPVLADIAAAILAFPANKLIVNALGQVRVSDLYGNVWGRVVGEDYGASEFLGPGVQIDAQAVRDALKLAPTAGEPAAGSVDAELAALSSAADPLLNAVPGSYAQGTAGAALGRIGTGTIETVSPVSTSGDVTIDAGYDYYTADGRALTWTDATPATWPNLTGATAKLHVGTLEVSGAITNPTGPATITVELSRTQTAALGVGTYPFYINVTLSNGHLVLQVRGMMVLR